MPPRDGKIKSLYRFNNEKNMILRKKYNKIFVKTQSTARLSSSFGMRKHPILGYNKMQRNWFRAQAHLNGISFGWYKSKMVWRGKCVKIKHNSTYHFMYRKHLLKVLKKNKTRTNNWLCWTTYQLSPYWSCF